MTAIRIIALLLGVFVTLPIALYLQYRVLIMVGATEVMWLLFWVYVPVALFVSILLKIVETFGDKK